MNLHIRYPLLLLPVLVSLFGTSPISAQDVDETPIGEAVERHLSIDNPFMPWMQDPERIDSERGDTIETREVLADDLETIKLSNLVEPVRFASGIADIPDSTVESLGEILERMRDRRNVRLHLVGHADNRPLSPALMEIYGDNEGLSRERAGQVAEHMQTALSLPAEAISYEWAGDASPVATNLTEEGRALNRRVEVEVWYDEIRERVALEEFLVPHQINTVKVCRMETVCKLRYIDGHAQRARVRNLVAPLHYASETIDVNQAYIERIEFALENLGDKQNVIVKFVGFTDDVPLAGRTERIYGDHVGLSKARARRVSLAVQDALDLPTTIIESDGRGATRPLGSNETTQGRALNRRVEVEFWYDDPLQSLSDEPQLCPEDAAAVTVTKVYDPSWGQIPVIDFTDGSPVVPLGFAVLLEQALADVADKTNPRLRFVGYTRNERLARRTAAVYGDDIELSASRARRAMEQVVGDMQLEPGQTEFEGLGFVHSTDVVNAGFTQGDTSHVAVQVVYDELAVLDDYEGVDITRLTREIQPENPLGLNLMRITVDGKPIDDPKRSSSDIQRCTDVALAKADIRFGFDNLRSAPRLSVNALPANIRIAGKHDPWTAPSTVNFRMYTNYSYFIERAEIRVFRVEQSLEAEPLEVINIDLDGEVEWQPLFRTVAGGDELAYVLRAYSSDGNFDETQPQSLWLNFADADPPVADKAVAAKTPFRYSSYGENKLAVQNIGLGSGTVSVQGSGVPEGHEVWIAGRPIPIDDNGEFIAEEILPDGAHTVEVAGIDEGGAGELCLRELECVSNDWFYVGIADLTISQSSASGRIDELQGENSPYDYDSNFDGRLAFFVDGKFGDHWRLTASADTREGPLDQIFSNFLDKSPDALFRRIDPDYFYPTFGDDGTVEEMAPTMGKFFVRVSDGDDYAQWASFKVGYMNNELAQVDRGLYGANVHYQSDVTTDFGDRRFTIDGFAAEPGTIPSREEFRGTGGSLYFLQRQDILVGSERVRIELRDKASGIVTGVINLAPVMDYDIDYLQGRILLSEPLASTADDNLLVRSGAISGDEAHLVVRYEYTPGFDEIDSVALGGQVHYWFGDYVKLGLTSNVNQQNGDDSSLNAADLTLRLGAESWLKVQQAESEGLVSLPLVSTDGGFEFSGYDPASFVNAKAGAERADISIAARDLFDFTDARLTAYVQEADAGYSAPGMTALTDTRIWGGTFKMPIGSSFFFGAKVDDRVQDLGIETRAQEYNVGLQLTDNWDINAGYRLDKRTDGSVIVPLTQEEGERADAILQIGYNSTSNWSTYAFMQDTLSTTGNRKENARTGVGGSFQVSEKLKVDAEVSDGDLGAGGRLGTNYQLSENTSTYLNYTLDNERGGNGLQRSQGSEGNLVAGVRSRLSDSASVFLEERYQHSDSSIGLTQTYGISFTPTASWSLGLSTDIGTLQDVQTGAETERLAGGLQVGFGGDSLQFTSGVEYRFDDAQQLDLSRNERTTWLFRNSLKYQVNASGRLLGKLNHSESESSLGTFYDGGFSEAVIGYAYRPVNHDRLNVLAKYTYFYNVPTTGQVTLQNVAAEFIQKSHIAALDVSYDLTSRITIGGKYAYRQSQVSLDRDNPEFFANNANLYVLRGDYRFRENWELLLEGRLLDMPDLQEHRLGALTGISRYFGDHLKMGLGYNFTDFSDDLTQLNFVHQGLFLNLTGSM